MLSSTAKQTKTREYNLVHAKPFTRVHRRPSRKDYKILKEEPSALDVDNITYMWNRDATNEYGLLADVIRVGNYDNLTGIYTYTVPIKLATYDPTITNATPTNMCSESPGSSLQGIIDNQWDALDKQY
jgi:hypothetical protein